MATERHEHQAWAERQRQALIDAGVSPLDAQQRVDWVLQHLPAGVDPSEWVPTGYDLDEPLDEPAANDANSSYMVNDATPGEFLFLLSAKEEEDE